MFVPPVYFKTYVSPPKPKSNEFLYCILGTSLNMSSEPTLSSTNCGLIPWNLTFMSQFAASVNNKSNSSVSLTLFITHVHVYPVGMSMIEPFTVYPVLSFTS